MKLFGNTLRPFHIFLILSIILLVLSVLLGSKIVEGLTNSPGGDAPIGDASASANTSYDPTTFDSASGTPSGSAPVGDSVINGSSIDDDSNDYGQGIPKSQIPDGDEDMYILKSQIVPPVCPACPTVSSCPRKEPCPACPPCARCPEPSFECKKVPNYSSNDDRYLPRPVLADFSQFGM
jgi:hypothetical protein